MSSIELLIPDPYSKIPQQLQQQQLQIQTEIFLVVILSVDSKSVPDFIPLAPAMELNLSVDCLSPSPISTLIFDCP